MTDIDQAGRVMGFAVVDKRGFIEEHIVSLHHNRIFDPLFDAERQRTIADREIVGVGLCQQSGFVFDAAVVVMKDNAFGAKCLRPPHRLFLRLHHLQIGGILGR